MTAAENVRSFTLLGSPGCGKTAIAEALLYRARVIPQPDGGKVLDTDPEEIKRRTTLASKVQMINWEGVEVSFADTPGSSDFIGGAVAALQALDAAVIVVDASTGVDVATRQMYDLAIRHGRPVVLFVNKLDRENTDFQKAVSSIRANLTKKAHPFVLPIGSGAKFEGLVDLVEGKAYAFSDRVKEIPIPQEMQDDVKLAQAQLVEEVAGTDEALFEKLASGEDLTTDDILPRLAIDVDEGEIIPILAGCATPPKGATILLEVVRRYIRPCVLRPAPSATLNGQPVSLTLGINEPALAQIFKVTSDPGVGELFFMRIVNGTLRAGEDLVNTRTQDRERIGHMIRFQGKDKKETDEASVGQIVAVAKLKHSQVGDTLSMPNKLVDLGPIDFPNPVHSITVLPQTRKDQDKLGVALGKITQTDPTIHTHMDAEFNEIVLAGMGEVHLDVVAARLRDKFGVNITLGQPHVAYRETLAKAVKAQGRHKKQTGGHGQFGDAWISMEPLPIGSGFEFVDEIKGGVVPNKFIPSVETGVRESMKRGGLVGFPVVDLRVALYDGSYHSVDSSDVAFQMAGAIAFRKCLEMAGTIILEPIMRMRITVLGEHVGAITSDMNSRRGRILGMESVGELQVINAEVAQSEIFRYSTDLRSMTQGAGTYTMEFARYEPMPAPLASVLKEKMEAKRKEAQVAG
ncbi:MAG TPA: elongation factor G [Polyangiaceae bacterium]